MMLIVKHNSPKSLGKLQGSLSYYSEDETLYSMDFKLNGDLERIEDEGLSLGELYTYEKYLKEVEI